MKTSFKMVAMLLGMGIFPLCANAQKKVIIEDEEPNSIMFISRDKAGDEIIRCFGKRKYFIKSKTMRKEKTEMAVELFCKQTDMDFMEKIRAIEQVEDVTLIQYNGEYHG